MLKTQTNVENVLKVISRYKNSLSLNTIARLTDLSTTAVFRALRYLEGKGDIVKVITWTTKDPVPPPDFSEPVKRRKRWVAPREVRYSSRWKL